MTQTQDDMLEKYRRDPRNTRREMQDGDPEPEPVRPLATPAVQPAKKAKK
jgi:hypothetical protein